MTAKEVIAGKNGMKNCGYCGCENYDNAVFCADCRRAFNGDEVIQPNGGPESGAEATLEIGKWVLYLAAWGMVALVTCAGNPQSLLVAPAFPIGLFGLLPESKAITAVMAGNLLAIPLGWGFYLALTIAMGQTKRSLVFFTIYIGFCILLALNAVGCRSLMDTAAGIH